MQNELLEKMKEQYQIFNDSVQSFGYIRWGASLNIDLRISVLILVQSYFQRRSLRGEDILWRTTPKAKNTILASVVFLLELEFRHRGWTWLFSVCLSYSNFSRQCLRVILVVDWDALRNKTSKYVPLGNGYYWNRCALPVVNFLVLKEAIEF
jgi:hypothetical protein